jgi:hypothetical protein
LVFRLTALLVAPAIYLGLARAGKLGCSRSVVERRKRRHKVGAKEVGVTTIDKEGMIQEAAEALYARNPDWVTFYREMWGLEGVIRRHYPTLETLSLFEETETYGQVQRMLRKLREYRPLKAPENATEEDMTKKEKAAEAEDKDTSEPPQVITIRLPRCLHDALRVEAHEHRTSMNKLCISKLMQLIDAEMVPSETFGVPKVSAAKRRKSGRGVDL